MDRDMYNYMEKKRQEDLEENKKRIRKAIQSKYKTHWRGFPINEAALRQRRERVQRKIAEANQKLDDAYYKDYGGRKGVNQYLAAEEIKKGETKAKFKKAAKKPRQQTTPNTTQNRETAQRIQTIKAHFKQQAQKSNTTRTFNKSGKER